VGENGELGLKRNHNYYYQIQGQLHIAGRYVLNIPVRVGTGTVPTVPTYEDTVGTVPTRILLLQKVEVEEPIE